MVELVFGLVVGAGIGYAFRSYVSHRRRTAGRRPRLPDPELPGPELAGPEASGRDAAWLETA